MQNSFHQLSVASLVSKTEKKVNSNEQFYAYCHMGLKKLLQGNLETVTVAGILRYTKFKNQLKKKSWSLIELVAKNPSCMVKVARM